MDAAYLYGGHFFRGCADFLPTGVYGAWTGKNQPAACVFKKTDFADTADFYSAVFFYKQGMGRVYRGAGQRHYCGVRDGDDVLFASE